MCGIAWYSTDGLDEAQVSRCVELGNGLAHRGPDDTSVTQTENSVLVFHRLAIINPSAEGMQPFGGLICNGEIYNYTDLIDRPLRSDCEVISKLLEQPGDVAAKIDSLDGDFAFVYDRGQDSVIAARDRFGVCPLFYGTDAEGTVRAMSSEVKALVGAPGISGVHVFPPGHVLVDGEFVSYTTPVRALGATYEEAMQGVSELMQRAVHKRVTHSDRPVGVLCSGGIDSSIVACLIARMENIRVFTMEYEGARSEDAFYARMLCRSLGVDHTVFSFCREEVLDVMPRVVRACETHDAITVRAAIPMFLLAHKIAETGVRVVLSGEGADELFQGYSYFRKATRAQGAIESKRLVDNIHMFDLLRAERCFASAGIEVRVPFLDKDLVRYVQSLPPELFRGKIEKQLLRDASPFPELQATRIAGRPKERFSDGCGFSYVPQLLVDICAAPFLEERLESEKKLIGSMFDANYPACRHLIIPRVLPEWATAGSIDTDPTKMVCIG